MGCTTVNGVERRVRAELSCRAVARPLAPLHAKTGRPNSTVLPASRVIAFMSGVITRDSITLFQKKPEIQVRPATGAEITESSPIPELFSPPKPERVSAVEDDHTPEIQARHSSAIPWSDGQLAPKRFTHPRQGVPSRSRGPTHCGISRGPPITCRKGRSGGRSGHYFG